MRQDSTLLILHTGNYEYICVRHRKTQTLYISDILHVPYLKDPGYGKVQVAIYMTAIDDALRRIAAIEATDSPSTPVRTTGGSFARADNLDAHPNAGAKSHVTIMRKGPKRRSRGRSLKRQRQMDWEVSVCVCARIQIERYS